MGVSGCCDCFNPETICFLRCNDITYFVLKKDTDHNFLAVNLELIYQLQLHQLKTIHCTKSKCGTQCQTLLDNVFSVLIIVANTAFQKRQDALAIS